METPQSFEVYGFTFEVHAGGRRVWPPSFKRFIKTQLDAGDLTIDNVTKTCNVSQSLVYKWRADIKAAGANTDHVPTEPLFSQIVVSEEKTIEKDSAVAGDRIHLTTCKGTIDFPAGYRVDDLVKIILAVNAQP